MAYISKITLPDGQQFDIKGNTVLCDTTENWATRGLAESVEGLIYVWTDYQVVDGVNVPGVKIGTGNAYIIDLPFIDAKYAQHITDTIIHISQQERVFWNNKVTAEVDSQNPTMLMELWYLKLTIAVLQRHTLMMR